MKAREAKRSPRRDSARRRSPSPPARRSRSPRADRERARERSRSRSPVRRERSRSPPRSKGAFKEGDRVEARFRGREKYYPGKIRTDRGDGTYDVSYDDGATETRVREDLIRAASRRDVDDDSRDGGDAKLRSGDKCEARYRGRDKWYPGVVGRANVDGSYDVDYDDGERERAVDGRHVRARGGAGGRGRSPARSDDRRGDDDENERLKRRLRDLEDKLTGDRAGSLGRRDDARASRDAGSDLEALARENRELRRELGRGGARGGSALLRSGDFGYDAGRGGKQPPWHAMVNQDDDVIDELVGAIGTGHGSVGQWLNTSATPLEKRNFIEFVQTLEEFEGRRGLTPQNRSADDISGTIHLALGPTIRCQLKFLV